MRESDIERYLVDAARRRGGVAVKHVSPSRAGEPDRLVVLPMETCAVCGCGARVGLLELKRPGERPRPLQEARLAEYARLGVPAGWASSKVGVDAFLAALGSRGPGNAAGT